LLKQGVWGGGQGREARRRRMLSSLRAALRPPASRRTACHRLRPVAVVAVVVVVVEAAEEGSESALGSLLGSVLDPGGDSGWGCAAVCGELGGACLGMGATVRG
jgi:hypothetical protein